MQRTRDPDPVPRDHIIDKIRDSNPRIHGSVDCHLTYLRQHLESFSVDLDPEYQRGHVWTEDQQEAFMGALLKDSTRIPPIYLNYKDAKDQTCEVVDGKQRITAMLRWWDGEISARLVEGIVVHRNDFKEQLDLRKLGNHVTIHWRFVKLNRIEVMKFYVGLNAGGTPHSTQEINRVRGLIDELTKKGTP